MRYSKYIFITLVVSTLFGVHTAQAKPQFVWPTSDHTITAGYKGKGFPGHRGIDFAGKIGDPVFAAADGKVVSARCAQELGCFVTLRHPGKIRTVYVHLDEFVVEKGQRVTAGQVIGAVGNTGFSTGPHLHFEVRRLRQDQFKPVNPLPYLLKTIL